MPAVIIKEEQAHHFGFFVYTVYCYECANDLPLMNLSVASHERAMEIQHEHNSLFHPTKSATKR